MTWEAKETETETTVTLGGACTIAAADDLAARMRGLLDLRTPLVTLDLGAVEAADVTFLQLMLSLQKSLRTQGRNLLLRSLPPAHEVGIKAALLGVPLGLHFTFVEPAS